jgi:hypothetical protein
MIHQCASSIAGHLRVTFELPASLWADDVCVVGNFNQWQPGHTPLRQARDGRWRAALDLPVGQQYHFRYQVDGAWHTDNQADDFSADPAGLPTSLLDITALPAAAGFAEWPLHSSVDYHWRPPHSEIPLQLAASPAGIRVVLSMAGSDSEPARRHCGILNEYAAGARPPPPIARGHPSRSLPGNDHRSLPRIWSPLGENAR